MSRTVAIFLFALLISSTACALTSSSANPTPVVLLPTLSPSQTPTPITPTPTATATTASTGGVVTTGNTGCIPRTDWATYIVVPGDTLGKIAERSGTTAQQLAAANCLSNANIISVGQPLRVPRQPAALTATPRPSGNVIDLNPAGDPPGNVCVVRNPNPGAPIQVYVDGSNNNLVASQHRLVTWAPFVGVREAWYQISIPNTGANWVAASQAVLVGPTCPSNYQICVFTYVGSGRFVAHSGAGSNYPYSVELPGNTPLPVLARSDGWVQVGTDSITNGWIETASGRLEGPCDTVWYIPIREFQSCLLTMSQYTQAYSEPRFDAGSFIELVPNQQIEATTRTTSGWYGYVPSGGSQRYWVPAGVQGYSHISRTVGCDALSVS